jgi:tetratricopeptide (TPR) repeat protein
MVSNRLFSVFAASGVILLFTVFAGCVSAETVSLYRPVAQAQVDLSVDEWVERGDGFFYKDDYTNARECYFRALIADPSRIDVLNAYGVTLANTGFYENALVIFTIALRIDPTDEVVQYNISFCRQQIAIQTEQQRQLQLQAQQQQQENFQNLIASLNTLASSVQQRQGGGGTGGYSGGQGQAESSGSSSSSSGREDRHIANNPASAQRTYNNYARAAKGHYDNIVNAKRSGEPSSRIRELENSLRNCQNQMRDFRLEAQRQGVTIRQDEYETKSPPN